jgi:D-alanyl-D-alanine carboxypeptidase
MPGSAAKAGLLVRGRRLAARLLLALAAGLVLVPSTMHGAPATPPLVTAYPPPPLLGSAAVAYDLDSGETLYTVNSRMPLPVASTTKLMTALLVLEHGGLAAQTSVSYHAATIGQSTMNLRYGERLSIRDLLYGLLLPSGNDAAIALAEATSGSEAAFVLAMNARCLLLGCVATHFTTPHGLDGYGNYSSAHDLLLILRADLRYATFRAIAGTRTYLVPATAHNYSHWLINVDEPLWWYPAVAGGKPGNTAAAGFCSALYVTRGTKHLAVVILGMPDRYTDVRDLVDFALGDFTWHSPAGVSPALASMLYPPDDLSQDGTWRYLAGRDAAGSAWRYYVGSGYYAREPFLGYLRLHPALGLPTSQASASGGTMVQRFTAATVVYHAATGTFAPLARPPAG